MAQIKIPLAVMRPAAIIPEPAIHVPEPKVEIAAQPKVEGPPQSQPQPQPQ